MSFGTRLFNILSIVGASVRPDSALPCSPNLIQGGGTSILYGKGKRVI